MHGLRVALPRPCNPVSPVVAEVWPFGARSQSIGLDPQPSVAYSERVRGGEHAPVTALLSADDGQQKARFGRASPFADRTAPRGVSEKLGDRLSHACLVLASEHGHICSSHSIIHVAWGGRQARERQEG